MPGAFLSVLAAVRVLTDTVCAADVLNEIVRDAGRPKGPDGEPEKQGPLSGVMNTLGSFSKFLTGLSR